MSTRVPLALKWKRTIKLAKEATSGSDTNVSKREILAWCLVFLLGIAHFTHSAEARKQIMSLSSSSDETTPTLRSRSSESAPECVYHLNDRPPDYYTQKRQMAKAGKTKSSYYDPPILYPKDAGLVQRIWRSNGAPSINSKLQQGSCWCSADEWCMCTPSLAVDLILTSGLDHVWLVRREDTGMLALMGGFTEVGETSAEAAQRELLEEMNIEMPENAELSLFGVYNDPKRDERRHTTSVVYIFDVPDGAKPKAGDDATNVVRLSLKEVENRNFFIDHKTILMDYKRYLERLEKAADGVEARNLPPEPYTGDGQPFKRSVCPM